MKLICSLLLLLLVISGCGAENEIPDTIDVAITANHKRVPGTRVHVVVPKTYVYIREMARYQRTQEVYIQFMESGEAFSTIRKNYDKDSLESKGTKLAIWKELKVNGCDAVYIEGNGKTNNEHQFGIVFGDNSGSVIVIATCPSNSPTDEDDLRKIILSISFDKNSERDPMELLHFEFDKTITNFKLSFSASNMYAFNRSGKLNRTNPIEDGFVYMPMPTMSKDNAIGIIRSIIERQEASGIVIERPEPVEVVIGDYSGLAVESAIRQEGTSGRMYMVMLFNAETGLIFQGVAYGADNPLFEQFKQTLRSTKFKEKEK